MFPGEQPEQPAPHPQSRLSDGTYLWLLTAPGGRVAGPSMGPYTEWKDIAQVRPCCERQAVGGGGRC